MSKNYYDILGISRSASSDEIKKAYRANSLKFHPDKPGGDQAKFQELNEAYETLSDNDKKRIYDNRGMGNRNPMGNRMPHGMPPEIFQAFFNGQQDPFGAFGRMGGPNIRVYHNRQQVPPKIRKPDPIVKEITLDIKEAFNGNSAYMLSIQKRIIKDSVLTNDDETIYIEIPEGIDSNEKIILRDRGHITEGVHGDINLIFKINNDTKFIRDGLNLTIHKDISLKEALCGFYYEIDHINGKNYKITNQKGNIVKPGYIREICGMGMKRDGQIGRLFINFNIIFPKDLSDDKIEQLDSILSE